MENNKTITTMTKVTLTPAELSDIIDTAFRLGKVYACDELQSAGYNVPSLYMNERSEVVWNKAIEEKGGNLLNSGDAKLDILWDACAASMKESLKDVIDY